MSYKKLTPEDFSTEPILVEVPVWSTGDGTHPYFYLKSEQTASYTGTWFFELYQEPIELSKSSAQLALSYAHISGSGSNPLNVSVPSNTPTKILYSKYSSLVLHENENQIMFGSQPAKHFFAISFARNRFGTKLSAKSFELKLASGSYQGGLPQNIVNASRLTLKSDFYDLDSDVILSSSKVGEVFEILSQNNSGDLVYSNSGACFGKIYPEAGLILINADTIESSLNTGTPIDSQDYNKILANFVDYINKGGSFKLKSKREKFQSKIVVRAKAGEMNYSMNPTFMNEVGEVHTPDSINNPKSYVTTIGLYSDTEELLAVAKYPSPMLKDFSSEIFTQVNLIYDTPILFDGPLDCNMLMSSSGYEADCNLTSSVDYVVVHPSPSVTVTPSATISVTASPSITPSITVSPSITPSNSITPSITPTISITPSITPTLSFTPTPTPTISFTPSPTPSTSTTPSITPTLTPSVTTTPSSTPSVSATPSISISPTPSATPSPADVDVLLIRESTTTGVTTVYSSTTDDLVKCAYETRDTFLGTGYSYFSTDGLVVGTQLYSQSLKTVPVTITGKFVVDGQSAIIDTVNGIITAVVEFNTLPTC